MEPAGPVSAADYNRQTIEEIRREIDNMGRRISLDVATPVEIHEPNWCAAFGALACAVTEARTEILADNLDDAIDALEKAAAIIEKAWNPLVTIAKGNHEQERND